VKILRCMTHSACSSHHYWNTSCSFAGPASRPLLIAGLVLLCLLLPALVVVHWAQEMSSRMTFHRYSGFIVPSTMLVQMKQPEVHCMLLMFTHDKNKDEFGSWKYSSSYPQAFKVCHKNQRQP